MNHFQKIYSILHSEYGPQGWWPLSGKSRAANCETGKGLHVPKHHNGPPHSDKDRFEIMLGAILTQNTAWTNVEKALEQLHKNRLVGHDKILSTKKEKLATLIRSAGYYNQKAERLAIISRFVKEHTIKGLMKKDTALLREMLLSVKGIGPETADSIVLYAFEKPSFVIDAYTKRIFSRIGLCAADVDYHELQNMFMDSVKKDVGTYQEYHALIVEHAKQHCRTKPECKGCPVSDVCKAAFKNPNI